MAKTYVPLPPTRPKVTSTTAVVQEVAKMYGRLGWRGQYSYCGRRLMGGD